MKCAYCGKTIWPLQTVVIKSGGDYHDRCAMEDRMKKHMERLEKTIETRNRRVKG